MCGEIEVPRTALGTPETASKRWQVVQGILVTKGAHRLFQGFLVTVTLYVQPRNVWHDLSRGIVPVDGVIGDKLDHVFGYVPRQPGGI